VCADPKLEFAGGAQVRTNYRRGVPALLCAPALIVAMGLSACGGTDWAASGENVIRTFVNNNAKAGRPVKLDSVSCPSNVKGNVGESFDCKAKISNTTSNQSASGTITVHIIAGNKVAVFGAQDVHIP
jgi:hypothetical protein